jgi:Cu(I)/Ag(I) efflux system periplasmic protein CusF
VRPKFGFSRSGSFARAFIQGILMKKLFIGASLTVGTLLIALGLQAQTASKPATAASAAGAASAATPEWVNAEVTKLDLARKRVTLKHAPIASIKMDAMTMPFKLKDAALFEGYKVGDKLQIVVKNDDGDLFITQVRKAAN